MTNWTCPLCLAIFHEDVLGGAKGSMSWETSYGILKTKNNKGHAKRVMIVSYEHTMNANYDIAYSTLFEFIVRNHRDHDWAIFDPTHATIKDHFHLVASTIDDMGEDWEQIKDTDRIEIRFVKRENP